MMRPSVSSPTGTEIGSPVSVTSCPRTRPSEMSIATVRTVDSPRCCATSSTRRLPPLVVSSAFRIAGRWPSNCTSTTAPMTWVIRPVGLAMWSSYSISLLPSPARGRSAGEARRVGVIQVRRSPPGRLAAATLPFSRGGKKLRSQRLGTRNDLDQFLGDHRLARTVVGDGLLANHFARIARRIVHRAHARALLGCSVLQQRAEHLHGDIARQQLVENVDLFGLVFIGRGRGLGGLAVEQRRDDLLRGRDLRDHRLEAREEQRRDVERALVEQRDDLVGDQLGLREPDIAHAALLDRLDDLRAEIAPQLLEALAADAEELDGLA